MKTEEFIKLVRKLNDLLPEEGFGDIEYNRFFYTTDGYTHIIGFADNTLWYSEDDDRECDEHTGERLKLEVHIISKMHKYNDYLPPIFKTETLNYKKGFEELMCYFDSISDEEKPKINKILEDLGL